MEVITCLEIDDNYVSSIIGYLTEDNKVALLYKNVKRFDVEDIFSLKPTIVAQTIVDLISNAKYSNIQFNNFYALLSPKKCNSYSSTVLTYVSNSDSIVSETDINNLMSMAKKKNIRDDQKIVEIIPVSFKLSNGNELKVKPIGEKSNEISMSYKFHCVDINTYNYYSEIFKICNLNQVQFLISSINLPNIFRNIKNFPSNYFLVFSKENITNITLLGKGEPIKTNTIKFGFIDLYKKIANHFNISIQNAKRLVKIFGFDKDENYFKINLANALVNVDNSLNISQKDLNLLITDFLQEFISNISKEILSIANITKLETEKVASLNTVFLGETNLYYNFKEYLTSKFSSNFIFYVPNIINLHDYAYYSSYACILCSKNINSFLKTFPNKREINDLKRGN